MIMKVPVVQTFSLSLFSVRRKATSHYLLLDATRHAIIYISTLTLKTRPLLRNSHGGSGVGEPYPKVPNRTREGLSEAA